MEIKNMAYWKAKNETRLQDSPLDVCAPGDTGCGVFNRKFDKPGTVVSRTAKKVGSWLGKTFSKKPKSKKLVKTNTSKGTGWDTPRHLAGPGSGRIKGT